MYSFLGVAGALLILFGFYRTSIGRWSGKSLWYELDNFVGAICLTIYQWHYRAVISAVLNVVWAIVALKGISSLTERRRKKS